MESFKGTGRNSRWEIWLGRADQKVQRALQFIEEVQGFLANKQE
jgi:hypothetical protein